MRVRFGVLVAWALGLGVMSRIDCGRRLVSTNRREKSDACGGVRGFRVKSFGMFRGMIFPKP